MGANQSRPRILQNVQFRVLIIGRANAGKTTILQKVCDTTDSPTVYRNRGDEREEVCRGGVAVLQVLVSPYNIQVKLDPSMEVSNKRCYLLSLLNRDSESAWRTRYR